MKGRARETQGRPSSYNDISIHYDHILSTPQLYMTGITVETSGRTLSVIRCSLSETPILKSALREDSALTHSPGLD